MASAFFQSVCMYSYDLSMPTQCLICVVQTAPLRAKWLVDWGVFFKGEAAMTNETSISIASETLSMIHACAYAVEDTVFFGPGKPTGRKP